MFHDARQRADLAANAAGHVAHGAARVVRAHTRPRAQRKGAAAVGKTTLTSAKKTTTNMQT